MTHKPSLLVLTETWNTVNSEQLCRLDGFTGVHVFRDRVVQSGGVGGGVSVFYDSNLVGDKADEISICDHTIEICCCRIYFEDTYILVLGIYRPHTDTIPNFLSRLENILNHDIAKNSALILIAGDININMCDPAMSEGYVSLMFSYNFLPAVTRPTRFSQAHDPNSVVNDPINNEQIMNNINSFQNFNSCSNLDHIWLGKIEQFTSGILLFDLADHLPTFIFFHHRIKQQKNDRILIKSRPFSDNNMGSFINDVNNVNWDEVLLGNDDYLNIHNSCLNFCTHLDEIYCKNFPLKTKYVSEKRISKPWLNGNLKKLINKKSEYLKKFRLGLISKETNNLVRNEVNCATRAAKNNFYRDAYNTANNDMKKSWAITRKLLGVDNKKQNVAKLIIDDVEYTDPSNIADHFNNYFSSVADQLDALLPPTDTYTPTGFGQVNSFYLSPLTEHECTKIIINLKVTKTGIDSMPVSIFKKIADLIAPILCMLINLSFDMGVVPNCLKVARITPIYKKGDKTKPTNYRPIASLPMICKVYERSMANRLISYFDRFSIISLSQFGFQKNKSTTDAILHLLEFIYPNINSSKITLNILIDLRKAFDTVNHKLLIRKLFMYGIRGVPQLWFESYLENRYQYVSVESKTSSIKPINIGVPQGSILGPILFLIYINDLPSCTDNLKTTLFADDTTLSIANKNYEDLIPQINRELSNVQDWIGNNRLTVNIEKTELMIISNKTTNHNDNQIMFNNEYLKFTDCSMFLGLKFDNKLKFANNTNHLAGKIAKNVGLFSKIRHNLPEKARLNFYYSLIFPYLSQNIIIWGKAYGCHLEPLILLQKRMIRLITNSPFLEHTNPLFYRLKILKLEDIYTYFAGIYMHKSLKMGKYKTQHSLNTRNRNLAQPVFQYFTRGQQSISFMGPTTWNILPEDIRGIDSPSLFKSRLKRFLINQYAP